ARLQTCGHERWDSCTDPPTEATVCRPCTTLPRPIKSGSPPKALAFTARCHQPTDSANRVLAARERPRRPHAVRPVQTEDDGFPWICDAASEAGGPLVSLTATMTATTAVVSARTQP